MMKKQVTESSQVATEKVEWDHTQGAGPTPGEGASTRGGTPGSLAELRPPQTRGLNECSLWTLLMACGYLPYRITLTGND